MDTKKKNPSGKTQSIHIQSDLDKDSDQTLFPKFIVLELIVDSPPPSQSCLPFIIEKKPLVL